MKLIGVLACLLLLIHLGCSQPMVKTVARQSNLSFHPIPYTDPEIMAPGRGAEQWHDRNEVPINSADSITRGADKYYRFSWSQIETGKNVYDWATFDAEINDAIDHGQQFSFGVMPLHPLVDLSLPYAVNMSGKASVYPLYLHEEMQSEKVKDWISPQAGIWIPNWNSEHYLQALEKLNAAINSHLVHGKHNGIAYKDVINYIDIRGYGNYGEWHEAYIVDKMSDHPAGTQATAATLKRIIDAHVQQFPDFQLVALVSVFDGNTLSNTMVPPEVGYHALTVKNNKGVLGWRRDNWGATDSYLERYLAGNTTTFNNTRFNDLIDERWKTAPVVGEPSHTNTSFNGCDYGLLQKQVEKYHASSFGNGNISNPKADCVIGNIRNAAKRTGYRLILEGGYIDSLASPGDSLHIRLDWRNTGVAPVYYDWETWLELRDLRTDSLVWATRSVFSVRGLLPADSATASFDHVLIPASISPGNYNISLLVKDPSGYRPPLPLAIGGRHTNGSYTLRSITLKK